MEEILEEHKLPVPSGAKGLDYLLFSPFRYDTRPPSGSRFRAINDPGVFYGAETVRTAAAEVAYWRPVSSPAPLLPFASQKSRCSDLRQPPFDAHFTVWTHPEAVAEIKRRHP